MRTTIQQLAEFLTACRGNWRNACFISCSAFEDIYALYLNWCLSDDESCCLQMLSILPSE